MNSQTLDAVFSYVSLGWFPIPVPAGRKEPVIKGWQNLRLSRETLPTYFSNGTNVGLLLGLPPANLVDVDLDWPEARAIATSFLPQTHRISGRAGAPRSHYWYIVEPLAKTRQFEDPLANANKGGRAMIVEFRSKGAQTIVPPSRHPSGEYYEWYEDGDAVRVNSKLLLEKVGFVAAGAILARYWPDGCRHDAALALAGGLLRAGWTVDATENFIATVATVAGDDQVDDRRLTVSYTAQRLNNHEETTGFPRLKELIPEQTVNCIIKWLGLKSISAEPVSQTDLDSIVIEDWPDPEPLPNGLLPVPIMDRALLPEPFAPWLSDIAELMQCPPDYPSIGAIVALASVVGNQIAIHPKQHDDWSVVPNLYGAIVGRPGVLKTPALEQALKPLHRLRVEARTAYEQAVSDWQIDRLMVEAKKEKLKDDIKRAAKSDKGLNRESFRRQQEEIENLVEPTERRYIINDSTVEKVGELLNQNPRGLLLFRDELTGWLRSLDREGREGDRAFYLEAWGGKDSFTYDRIGRGTLHIKIVTVSILGSIQPGPLTSYLRHTMSGGQGDDGLLQRFQLMVYPNVSENWRNVDRYVDIAHKNRAFEIFKKLDVINAAQLGAITSEGEQIPYLHFDEAGQSFFNSWRADMEKETRGNRLENPALEAHLAKYRSLMPSLALLFHLIDRVDGKTNQAAVSLDPATKAAAWCTYLFEHAKRIYGLAANATVNQARTIIEKARSGALQDTFRARDVYRNQWAGLTSAKEATEPLTLLEDFGWLRSVQIKSSSEGGRPTVHYLVNPKVKRDR